MWMISVSYGLVSLWLYNLIYLLYAGVFLIAMTPFFKEKLNLTLSLPLLFWWHKSLRKVCAYLMSDV